MAFKSNIGNEAVKRLKFNIESLDGDIEILYTGLRPGEKLYEELLVGDNVTSTDNNMIMRAHEKMIAWDKLKPMLDELIEHSNTGNQLKVRELQRYRQENSGG